MIRICPKPMKWHEVYQRLVRYSELQKILPPPKALILSGWGVTNDIEKKNRWDETIKWTTDNSCAELVDGIPESDFYFVDKPTSYVLGPMGGPMYRPWDFEKKDRPLSEVIGEILEVLRSKWSEIVGKELASFTYPLKFTGKKARRLLLKTNGLTDPPWGSWKHLSDVESKRRTFTIFRTAINKAIAPHEVDHVDFIVEKDTEQWS